MLIYCLVSTPGIGYGNRALMVNRALSKMVSSFAMPDRHELPTRYQSDHASILATVLT